MTFISENNLAALLGTSSATIRGWINKGKYKSTQNSIGTYGFEMEDLMEIDDVAEMLNTNWEEEFSTRPVRDFTSIELFAGGGGMALGMEKAGFKHVLLNEFDKAACNTLRVNRPEWNVIEGDVRHIDFTPLRGKIDFLSGGFPCQAFSYAGKQGGFSDIRGTMFFELARAVKEIQPKIFMGENVKGLVSHDNGRTFKTICNIVSELGYTLIPPKVLKAVKYQVPQKRERIILIAVRNDLAPMIKFKWPSPYRRIMTLKDAFYKSIIYNTDVPKSKGASYPAKKEAILKMVPPGGDWRDLPENIAKEYMGRSWDLGGGKTGMARRLSLEEPSLTLTCSPCQKQTERCHPIYTRPLSIREYARIQTFPDNWLFQGTLSDQYKQIGNAVPVNLAWAIGRSIIRMFNELEKANPTIASDCSKEIKSIMAAQEQLVVIKDHASQTSTIQCRHKQLNLFDLLDKYGENSIFENSYVSECICNYTRNQNKYENKKLLTALIPKELNDSFENRNGSTYFTGKRFPSTIDLKNIYFFAPYIKKKGIRDLYVVSKIRVGDRYNGDLNETTSDPRLFFEIMYIGQIFPDYTPVHLNIWHTYTSTTLNEIKSELQNS